MLIGPTEVSGGGFQSYMYRSYGRPPVKAAEIVIATNNGAAKSAETGFGTKNGGRIRREAPPPGEPAPDRSLATITALSLVSSAIVIFSPAASVYRCVAGKATEEEINGLAAPYFFLFAQSYFWALFGLEANNAEIANINIFGTVVCVIYLVVMAACLGTPEEGQKSMSQYQSKFGVMAQTGMTVRMLLGYGVLLCAVVSVFELLVEDDPLRSELLAYTALCFNISIFLYPMRQCADAIRKGTTVGFPVALSVAGFVSCALWAQYSALTPAQLSVSHSQCHGLPVQRLPDLCRWLDLHFPQPK